MSQYVAVSRERHSAKRWRRSDGFSFAAGDALVPAIGAELSKLAPTTPLAFVEQSGQFELVAILSLTPGKNMFVGPDGRWLSDYVPALYRAYPFRVESRSGTDEVVLCIDEDSALVVEEGAGGESFFDADGGVSPALSSIVGFLTEVERGHKATRRAVAALAEAGVIQPWPITLKTAQGEQAIGGLHRIDEAALNALGDDAFLSLRKLSALPVAYAQLLSMGQLGVFAQLARVQAQLAPPPVASLPQSLDSVFGLPMDDVVHFE
jgi:hypothetical protein